MNENYITINYVLSNLIIPMKEKTQEKAQTPAWMETEEFKAYDKNLRANQERGFQKKITQLKTEADAKEQRASQFKANLAKVVRNPEFIEQLKNEDGEMARDVYETLGKDFFEASKIETKVEFPPLNLDRDQIINEYKQQQASIARDAHIAALFEKFNSEVEWDSEDERAAFEKSANALLLGAKDDQVDDLFGYACSKRKKEHLIDSVVDSQKGFNGINGQPSTGT